MILTSISRLRQLIVLTEGLFFTLMAFVTAIRTQQASISSVHSKRSDDVTIEQQLGISDHWLDFVQQAPDCG